MKRRKFIRTAAAATTASLLIPSYACSRKVPNTGLILYTVRGEMMSNPEGTLDTIASIGFNWIEAADYNNGLFYDIKPADFRRMIESRGMSLISNHIDLDESNLDEAVNSAAEAGLRYVVVPSLPHEMLATLDAIKQTADFLNIAGEKCMDLGMRAGFHNHAAEFNLVEGQVPYNLLIENTDPELICFQMDMAYMKMAGADPLVYFNNYPGRFELWHIKDLSADMKFQTLGEGTIDFARIFKEAPLAGMQYFFIEQDECITHTPIESIEISRNFLLDNVL